MKAAFFHDHRFGRDASGVHYSNGAFSYRVFARYLRHFDELVVVGRVQPRTGSTRTIASGDRIEMDCVEAPASMSPRFLLDAAHRVRSVMARVDCAIIRLPSLLGQMACREARRAGKPWLVEVVGCPLGALWNHGSVAGKVLAVPSYLRARRAIGQAPFAVYVSESFLQRRYPCHGRSIACSNVAIEAPRAEVLERRLARVAAGGDRVVLGLVGSLDVDYKGHDTAIRALARLQDRFPGLTLRFLGGGDPARWRALAERAGVSGRVAFDGLLPGGAPVLEWLDALDAFLAPSRTEGLPRALVEAMSRALPALGSTAGGIPELLADSCIHPVGDDRALARLLVRLLGNPDERAAQALRNWRKAGEYAEPVLEERRARFLAEFRAFAEGRAPARAEELCCTPRGR